MTDRNKRPRLRKRRGNGRQALGGERAEAACALSTGDGSEGGGATRGSPPPSTLAAEGSEGHL